MSRLCRFFVILIAAYTAVGCFSPIGSIGGSGAAPDLLWAVPNRFAYNAGDCFVPKSDLQVFASHQGVVESVPVEKVKIGIAEDPDLPNKLKDIPSDKDYLLENKGRKIIDLKYGELSYKYSIEVSGGLENGTSPGIIIEWAD